MSKEKFKIKPWVIVVIPLTIIASPVLFYFHNFGNQGLSNSQEVWGQFGDFFNVWVSLASLVAISMLTYVIHVREQNLQDSIKEREDAINRPILSVASLGIYNTYRLKNIGLGPALDITTSFKPDSWYRGENSGNYVSLEHHPPLGPGGECEFSEYGASGSMVAVYSDIWGNKITTIYEKGKHTIKIGHDEFLCMTEEYEYAERPRNSDDI